MLQEIIDSSWSEKSRPKTLADCILPTNLKTEFQGVVKKRFLVDSIFYGKSGIGKTSVARAILDDIGADYIFINASLNGGIDTLRTTITQFASTVSLTGGRKYVICDEADRMGLPVVEALKGFIEEFQDNCGFVFTCNNYSKMSDHLKSRCASYEFKIPPEETQNIAGQQFKRACAILDNEGIVYEKAVVAALVKQYFPDFRKCINELQRYSAHGEINTGVFASQGNTEWNALYKALKERDFSTMRKWVGTNSIDASIIVKQLYDTLESKLNPSCIPQIILTLAEYQFRASAVVNQEINTVAMLLEIMANAEWQ